MKIKLSKGGSDAKLDDFTTIEKGSGNDKVIFSPNNFKLHPSLLFKEDFDLNLYIEDNMLRIGLNQYFGDTRIPFELKGKDYWLRMQYIYITINRSAIESAWNKSGGGFFLFFAAYLNEDKNTAKGLTLLAKKPSDFPKSSIIQKNGVDAIILTSCYCEKAQEGSDQWINEDKLNFCEYYKDHFRSIYETCEYSLLNYNNKTMLRKGEDKSRMFDVPELKRLFPCGVDLLDDFDLKLDCSNGKKLISSKKHLRIRVGDSIKYLSMGDVSFYGGSHSGSNYSHFEQCFSLKAKIVDSKDENYAMLVYSEGGSFVYDIDGLGEKLADLKQSSLSEGTITLGQFFLSELPKSSTYKENTFFVIKNWKNALASIDELLPALPSSSSVKIDNLTICKSDEGDIFNIADQRTFGHVKILEDISFETGSDDGESMYVIFNKKSVAIEHYSGSKWLSLPEIFISTAELNVKPNEYNYFAVYGDISDDKNKSTGGVIFQDGNPLRFDPLKIDDTKIILFQMRIFVRNFGDEDDPILVFTDNFTYKYWEPNIIKDKIDNLTIFSNANRLFAIADQHTFGNYRLYEDFDVRLSVTNNVLTGTFPSASVQLGEGKYLSTPEFSLDATKMNVKPNEYNYFAVYGDISDDKNKSTGGVEFDEGKPLLLQPATSLSSKIMLFQIRMFVEKSGSSNNPTIFFDIDRYVIYKYWKFALVSLSKQLGFLGITSG